MGVSAIACVTPTDRWSISGPRLSASLDGRPTDTRPTDAPPALPERYRIQRGDNIELTFPFVPTFNQSMVVQPDGFIFLRAIGDQRAEGLTVTELTDAVRTRYGSILREAVLTIELKDFERPYFVAAGGVERPGKYDIRGDTTLTEALAIAGGFTSDAKRTKVAVFRSAATQGSRARKVQEVDVKRLLEGREAAPDPRLESGDLVFVSRRRGPSLTTIASLLSTAGWLTVLVR